MFWIDRMPQVVMQLQALRRNQNWKYAEACENYTFHFYSFMFLNTLAFRALDKGGWCRFWKA